MGTATRKSGSTPKVGWTRMRVGAETTRGEREGRGGNLGNRETMEDADVLALGAREDGHGLQHRAALQARMTDFMPGATRACDITGNLYEAVPRFGEFCSCCCLPLLPQLACSILATWERPYRDSLYSYCGA